MMPLWPWASVQFDDVEGTFESMTIERTKICLADKAEKRRDMITRWKVNESTVEDKRQELYKEMFSAE